MSGWSTPPVAVKEKPGEPVNHTIRVYPIDHARTTEYVGMLFDELLREFDSIPIVRTVLRRNRQRMIDMVIPDQNVPPGFARFAAEETKFIEIALIKFYVGLEDRKQFPEDIRRLKAAISLSI